MLTPGLLVEFLPLREVASPAGNTGPLAAGSASLHSKINAQPSWAT